MSNLLIITGAGASHDVAARDNENISWEFLPPLTNALFRTGGDSVIRCVRETLEKNPVAAQVGNDFKMSNEPLEKYLASLYGKKTIPTVQKQYFSIPVYLHDLFFRISNSFIKSSKPGIPSHYVSLLHAIAESSYAKIIWLNLNYDLFADFALEHTTGHVFRTFSDYMNILTEERKTIKYTKPHGSVNWYRKNIHEIPWDSIRNGGIPDEFEERLSKQIYTEHESHEVGFTERELQLYPALLAPVGKYDYVCQKHIDSIRPDLKDVDSFLCIGFSAQDRDILDLLKDIPPVRYVKIVNGDLTSGQATFDKIYGNCGDFFKTASRTDSVFDGGFTSFVRTGIREWFKL